MFIKKLRFNYLKICLLLTISFTCNASTPTKGTCCNNQPPRIPLSQNNKSSPTMVLINGGTFMMGGDNNQARTDEFPKHKVTLDPYYIDTTPVTNEQFEDFIKRSKYITTAELPVDWEILKQQLPPETPKPDPKLLQPASLVFVKSSGDIPLNDPTAWWAWVSGSNWRHPSGPNSTVPGPEHPVVHVSWDDANAYCKYYDKRLPTEAEWEFAARGGLENKIYPWGNGPVDQGEPKANIWQGNFPYQNDCCKGDVYTTPVASYPQNGYGLYDMSGNVWEWVADWYAYDYYSEVKDGIYNPHGPAKPNDPTEPLALKKVIRGGSFLCNESYCTGYRVAARMRTSTDTSMQHLGFRCAQSK